MKKKWYICLSMTLALMVFLTAMNGIDESKINWQELEEKWGVKRDDLEKSGDLNKMLNYGKSDLVKVSPKFGGEAFELDARLSFKKDGEGSSYTS